jgi:hypothetical protein
MKRELENKTILFISPQFYGYEKIISAKMKQLGGSVMYYPERENGIEYKFINNFRNRNLISYQEKYYLDIYKKIKGLQIDFVFIIRGYLMPLSFIEKLRGNYPHATLIMHQWDSMVNNNYKKYFGFFDKFFSFDPEDCKQYALKYLPNFYLPQYVSEENKKKIKYDISFIGWAYEDRMRILEKISSQISEKIFFKYCYMPPIRHLLNILKGRPAQGIKTKPLLLSEVCNIIQQSAIILDITDKNQTGYPFRAIDAMAAGKRLITTNPFIQHEEFYDPRNILIIDRDHPNIDPRFFETPFVRIDIKNYSLDSWMKKIFCD